MLPCYFYILFYAIRGYKAGLKSSNNHNN